ncbi:MAG: 50S ribosomal protein L25, partial [Chloroflexota bacterium]
MTDRIIIEAEQREVIGKQVNQLRRSGWIPGVVYGRNDPVSIQMEQKALRRALRTVGTTNLAELKFGNNTKTVLVRDIQQHLTRGDILHVDFLEVDMASTIRSEAELVAIGEAPPEADGLGVVTLMLRQVEIECLPDNLISQIEIDMSTFTSPEDIIHVSDIPVPSGVTILTDPDTIVARFEYVTAEEEVEEEEIVEDEDVAED